MEIQIIHQSVNQNFKNQAVLSILFEANPGHINPAIAQWNLIGLPNPKERKK